MFNRNIPPMSILIMTTQVWRFAENSSYIVILKGLAQAKIIKKSVILFRVLNMTI